MRSRWSLVVVLALVLAGCLKLELHGRVAPDGRVSGTAIVAMPAAIVQHPELGPLLRGPGPTLLETWRRQGVELERLEQRYRYRFAAASVTGLALPWLHIAWQRHDGAFAYAQRVSFPARALELLEERLTAAFAEMAHHGANVDPEGLGRSFLGQAAVTIVWRFPGEVTMTDGERLADDTVRWRLTAAELRSGRAFEGYAWGRLPWWRRFWERLAGG